MSMVEDAEVVRENLKMLASPAVREQAMSESVGGNAGPGCYAVNLGVDDEGRIFYAGNDPKETNLTIRVFASAFLRGSGRIGEVIVDVYTKMNGVIRRRVSRSAWLWNLYREGKEKAILERFIRGDLEWNALVELLRAEYPELIPELQ